MTYQTLNKDVKAILFPVFLIVVIQFKHLVFDDFLWSVSVIQALVALQVVQAKGGPADSPPGIMGCFPGLAIQEGFSTPSLGPLVFHPFAKVGPNKVVARIDVEFLQEEGSRPVGVLTMNDPQQWLSNMIWLEVSQIGSI